MRHCFQLTFVAVLAGLVAGCQEASSYTKVEPAHVEHTEGSEISKLTLTEKAMERLDVQTAPVSAGEATGETAGHTPLVVPYSAILYVAKGDAFVYTSPGPRTFLRHPVAIERIEGDSAILKDGPPVGTDVAIVGVAELFGTEFGVGH